MILHGLSKGDYDALAKGPNTEVRQENALVKALVMVNPASPVFGTPRHERRSVPRSTRRP